MSRINLVNQDEAKGEAKELLDEVQQTIGVVPNAYKALANSPFALAALWSLERNLNRGLLDVQTRERIALTVAETNDCPYCISVHAAVANQVGLDEAEILANRRGFSNDAQSDAAVKFAQLLIEKRGTTTETEFNAVRDAGYNDGEIAEIISHVAFNTLMNYLCKAGQIDIDFPIVSLLDKQKSST